MIDDFSKLGWTILSKNDQTLKNYFEKTPIGSKRKSNLIETDRVKEIYNSIAQITKTKNDFLEKAH